MRLASLLLASCAAMTLHQAVALAADYDPPIFIEEAPEWVPVEIGSGWYLRGDVSYNAGRPAYDFTLFGDEVSHRRFGGSVGVGYHFTDHVRGDVTIAYHGRDEFSGSAGISSLDAEHKVWSGLLNGYLDIATVMGITPYVGAGLGLTYSKHNIEAVALPPIPDLGSQYSFAYALMAGAAYKVTDNLSVDLGYQFLHSPRMEYIDTNTLAVEHGTKQHQIRVGLRYDLW